MRCISITTPCNAVSEIVTLTIYIFNWKIRLISYLKILVAMGLTLLSKGGDRRIWDFFCVFCLCQWIDWWSKNRKLIRKFFIFLNKILITTWTYKKQVRLSCAIWDVRGRNSNQNKRKLVLVDQISAKNILQHWEDTFGAFIKIKSIYTRE